MNDDERYYIRRAAEESARARHTSDEAAAAVHRQLATLYRDRVAAISPLHAARQFANSL